MGNIWISSSSRMKILIISVLVICVSISLEMNPLQESSRNFCCSTFNAKQRCHDECQGRSCDDRCEQRCGIFNSFCGSWPCVEVNVQGCTQAPTPAPAPAPSSCVEKGGTCYVNNNFLTCCSSTAASMNCVATPVNGVIS